MPRMTRHDKMCEQTIDKFSNAIRWNFEQLHNAWWRADHTAVTLWYMSIIAYADAARIVDFSRDNYSHCIEARQQIDLYRDAAWALATHVPMRRLPCVAQ